MATAAHRSQSTAPESEALHQVIPSLSLMRRGLVNSNPSRTLAPSIARLTEKVKQRIERSHRLRDAPAGRPTGQGANSWRARARIPYSIPLSPGMPPSTRTSRHR